MYKAKLQVCSTFKDLLKPLETQGGGETDLFFSFSLIAILFFTDF